MSLASKFTQQELRAYRPVLTPFKVFEASVLLVGGFYMAVGGIGVFGVGLGSYSNRSCLH